VFSERRTHRDRRAIARRVIGELDHRALQRCTGGKATCMGLVVVLHEKALDVDDGVSARDCMEIITLRSQSGTNERDTGTVTS
jgi:hypothetical protein